jgi:hypothetical protein
VFKFAFQTDNTGEEVPIKALIVVTLKSSIFWDTMPCNRVKVNYLLLVSCWFLVWLFFDAEDEGDTFI